MAPALFIDTGWPARVLSPNASHQRNIWAKGRARKAAKNEGYLATCQALGRGAQFAPLDSRIRVTIHATPPTERRRDADNLIASVKALLDGIADRLKVDDSRFDAPLVVWHPPAKPGALRFEIEVQK